MTNSQLQIINSHTAHRYKQNFDMFAELNTKFYIQIKKQYVQYSSTIYQFNFYLNNDLIPLFGKDRFELEAPKLGKDSNDEFPDNARALKAFAIVIRPCWLNCDDSDCNIYKYQKICLN